MIKEQLRVPQAVDAAMCSLGIAPGTAVGVALSGGADSVALLLSLHRGGYRCTALHCNFGLRGAESEADEAFVRGMCDSLGVPLECTRFDVAARRALTGESVEMACRELRYEWFGKISRELGLEYVAVGHHMEDNVEGFFLNLLRGSGLPGLTGMQPRRGIYVRPMLRCSRSDIEAYLAGEGVEFMTDSSNLSDCYMRNKLRLRVLPELKSVQPGALERIERSMGFLGSDLELMMALVKEKTARYAPVRGRVEVEAMLGEPCAAHLLYRILNELWSGADADCAHNIVAAARRGESGRFFDVGGHTMLLDRGVLLLYEKVVPETHILDISRPETFPSWLAVRVMEVGAFHPVRDNSRLWLDASVLESGLALRFRTARQADRMAPFGMKGTRLLSDIFSDAKLSVAQKERVMVLVAADAAAGKETILWVPGLRSSRHFPVTEATTQVLELKADLSRMP